MSDNQNELYSVKLRAGSRTYFLNVKEDKKHNLYLVIKESKQNQDGGYDAHRVMIFEDDFSKFIAGMKDVLEFIKKTQAARPGSFTAGGTSKTTPNPDVIDPQEDIEELLGKVILHEGSSED